MTMHEDNQDKYQQFINSIKSALSESVEDINASNLSAITQSRNKALEGVAEKRPSWFYIPAGAFVTACLALVVYSFIQMTPDGQNLSQENLVRENLTEENIELVSVFEDVDYYEDPELYEELEFLEWLDDYESSS